MSSSLRAQSPGFTATAVIVSRSTRCTSETIILPLSSTLTVLDELLGCRRARWEVFELEGWGSAELLPGVISHIRFNKKRPLDASLAWILRSTRLWRFLLGSKMNGVTSCVRASRAAGRQICCRLRLTLFSLLQLSFGHIRHIWHGVAGFLGIQGTRLYFVCIVCSKSHSRLCKK